jgi:hypothetical protein
VEALDAVSELDSSIEFSDDSGSVRFRFARWLLHKGAVRDA